MKQTMTTTTNAAVAAVAKTSISPCLVEWDRLNESLADGAADGDPGV